MSQKLALFDNSLVEIISRKRFVIYSLFTINVVDFHNKMIIECVKHQPCPESDNVLFTVTLKEFQRYYLQEHVEDRF